MPRARRAGRPWCDAPCRPSSPAACCRSRGPPCRASRRPGSGRRPPRPPGARSGNRTRSASPAARPSYLSAQERSASWRRPAKSNSLRSSRCDGLTSVSARTIDSTRPGWRFSHSASIWRTASQPRAERAHRLALGDDALHHRVGVLLDDAIRYAAAFEILRKHLRWKPRLLLVHVHRHEIEPDRRFFFEGNQNVEKRMTILASREADHHAVACLDHVEVGDRLAHLPAQALGQLVFFVLDFARSWIHRKVERPPSTARICPVTKGAQARKCTASATSSGEPMRPSGVVARMRARSACSNWPSSGQAMAPGATPFTRTCGASSSASERVSAASPALAMLYTG